MGNTQSTSLQQQQEAKKNTRKNACPVIHSTENELHINPSNNIPELPQTPVPEQKRMSSTARRPGSNEQQDSKQTWVYPSPQQFYNALVRKGWETPEEAIPIMVDIHNWMNEAVWGEVLRWETRYYPAPHPPPPHTSGSQSHNNLSEQHPSTPNISLVKFQGRPQDLSPKARFHLLLSKVFPQLYNPVRPFDRHDWSICREDPTQAQQDLAVDSQKISRYVIDYYNGGHDEHGNPVFHFDVRPAIDDLDSLVVRLKEWARLKNERWFGIPDAADNSTPNPAAETTSIVQRDA
ncbi:hypothetical protein PCASD_18712 [Puccinia coronata f. sp. avenae]|uniref:Holocytochrome c-type synthase n=1 Tax=Puccinia coronata f. sp. avenae TaxID=200324 RepID=A0A2N5ST15_9BASI|nr:hypothetical protein PCASD_18712 [Puccinia coronata f. sp. avenae]